MKCFQKRLDKGNTLDYTLIKLRVLRVGEYRGVGLAKKDLTKQKSCFTLTHIRGIAGNNYKHL